jgi:hypothetical protein
MNEWSHVAEPGATPPVDAIPLLKFVPERWAKWKRDCRRIRTLHRALYFGLLNETKERLRRGDGNGSYMEEVLARKEELGMDNEMAGFVFLGVNPPQLISRSRYFGSALMEGGSETTSSYLQSLVLALVAYPEVQKKAHEEIDDVVGEHRMPILEDLEHMPYIRAVILEVCSPTTYSQILPSELLCLDTSISASNPLSIASCNTRYREGSFFVSCFRSPLLIFVSSIKVTPFQRAPPFSSIPVS